MANTNILNNLPFGDPTLKSTITNLQRETPLVTYYRTAAATTNPTTTPVSLVDYEIVYPADRPFEVRLEAIVSVLSNLSGDQEFTFTIYDEDDDATPYSFGAIDIPDALNTAIAVKLDWVMRATNAANTQWIQYGEISLVQNNAGATTSVVMPTNTRRIETAEDVVKNFQLRVTAETGTATTTVQLLSAKVSLDTQVESWN